jgi:DNA (cytosine-5)-methyltransferase 1
MKALSLFSGIMGLDLGIEQAGIKIIACCDNNKFCYDTVMVNRPDIIFFRKSLIDLNPLDVASFIGLPSDFILVGGPPCQSFSTGGNRQGLNDFRGNLVYSYFNFVRVLQPSAFIFENVANILTSALKHRPIRLRPGNHANLSIYSKSNCFEDDNNENLSDIELSGSTFKYLLSTFIPLNYSITFGILNAADFGTPQKRLRFFMLGFKNVNETGLPKPTHGPMTNQPYNTLFDAISDLKDNPGLHSIYTNKIINYFQKIPAGGNWNNLPLEEQKIALGNSFFAGGGKTGFFRRLNWDLPAPTLTTKANRKGTALCHPEKIRPLSVNEYKRIQGFPDDWLVTGTMSQQYEQIGNAVPIELGKAMGKQVLETLSLSKVKKQQSMTDLFYQMELSLRKLRSYACNNTNKKENRLFYA